MTQKPGFLRPETVERALGQPRWYLRLNLAIVAALLLLIVLAIIVRPSAEGIDLGQWRLPELCGYKRHTGQDCAGCGMTRSFVLAVTGRWRDSVAMHPSGIWLAVYVLGQLAGRLGILLFRPGGTFIRYADLVLSVVLLQAAVCLPLLATL